MRYAFCWFPVIGSGDRPGGAGCLLHFDKMAGGICFQRRLPDGGAFIGDRRHSSGWIYGYNGCQKFLWRQGEKAGNFKGFPCGGLCGDRLQLLSDFVGRAWSEIDAKGIVVMAMAFVLERAFSGLAAVNFKGARKDGMLTAFREPARKRTVTVVLTAEAVISAIVMCYLWLPVALLCSLGAVLTFVYYYKWR